MAFTLMKLPYQTRDLAPHISEETLEFHHGKHHQTYVDNLSGLLEKRVELQGKTLVELVKTTSGEVFNNAAQIWNHDFYWQSMSPDGGRDPRGALKDALVSSFGSLEEFRKEFEETATGHFGSGWAWLVDRGNGKLVIEDTHDADSPIRHGRKPLLTCDVWEHAYYLDYRNDRAKYIESWWNVVNWDFAQKNLESE